MARKLIARQKDSQNRFMPDQRSIEDILGGRTRGWLTILREKKVRMPQGYNRRIIVCQCKCGKIVERQLWPMQRTDHPSCGCYRAVLNGNNSRRHGHASNGKISPEYKVWSGMMDRCTNENTDAYKHYGGRGITVCDRWKADFVNFFEDMGNRPKGYSLDRIDVNGNYEPSNCRWATAKQQGQNRRNNVWLDVGGRKITAKDFCDETMISPFLIKGLVASGMTGDEIATKALRALENILQKE